MTTAGTRRERRLGAGGADAEEVSIAELVRIGDATARTTVAHRRSAPRGARPWRDTTERVTVEQARGAPTTTWGGLQRRLRRLVPRPVQRADLAVFRALARTEIPVLGPLLPRLSRAANHS